MSNFDNFCWLWATYDYLWRLCDDSEMTLWWLLTTFIELWRLMKFFWKLATICHNLWQIMTTWQTDNANPREARTSKKRCNSWALFANTSTMQDTAWACYMTLVTSGSSIPLKMVISAFISSLPTLFTGGRHWKSFTKSTLLLHHDMTHHDHVLPWLWHTITMAHHDHD